jgi:general secretion pathway protein B
MSYILEALKKAQAERQLGHAPDIHTPAPVQVPASAAPANRKPLLVGLGAGVLVAALLAVLAWRAQAPVAGERAVLAQASPAPAAAVAPPLDAAPAPSAEPARAPPAGLASAAPPASAPALPRARKQPAPEAPPAAAAPAQAAQDSVPEAVYLPAPARVAEAPPVARVAEPIPEESLRTLQQLPEAIQREVPRVTVGGYIYSPNPSDRLLLVDKLLRREGEEVAPGLVLERLMPKHAVMNYRGTRYRVAY